MYFCINIYCLGFPGGSVVKNLPTKGGDMNLITRLERSLEKERVSHSNILARKIL